MKNQFFYTRKERVGGSDEAPEYKDFLDSFNVNKVIRSVRMSDEQVLVVLDDFHERVENKPDIDIKTNKMKGVRRERNTFQSEIWLSNEDAERFQKLTAIE